MNWMTMRFLRKNMRAMKTFMNIVGKVVDKPATTI